MRWMDDHRDNFCFIGHDRADQVADNPGARVIEYPSSSVLLVEDFDRLLQRPGLLPPDVLKLDDRGGIRGSACTNGERVGLQGIHPVNFVRYMSNYLAPFGRRCTNRERRICADFPGPTHRVIQC